MRLPAHDVVTIDDVGAVAPCLVSHATWAITEPAAYVDSRTFDEITIADAATLVRTLPTDDIGLLALMSGDVTPTPVDHEYAQRDTFDTIVPHGAVKR